MRGFDLYHVGDGEVNARIDRIARQLKEQRLNLSALVTLAQIADTGITHVEVEERAIPPRFAQLVARCWHLPPTTVRNRLVIARQTKQKRSATTLHATSYFGTEKAAEDSEAPMNQRHHGMARTRDSCRSCPTKRLCTCC